MPTALSLAITSAVVAIAITTTMDATGYTMFSALPLLPLALLFWWLLRLSREEIGLRWGDARSNVAAVVYPVAVLGLMAGIAYFAGVVDVSAADWRKTWLNASLMSTTGVLVGMLTEEGFFRGWLWGALKRAGQSDLRVLVWTTLAFTLWHVSAVSLDTGFDVPAGEIPIYLVNVTVLGAVFGVFRMASGSLLAPSICHAIWNGIDYPFFGFGENVGALGIEATHIYGPEVGLLAVALNLLAAAVLWYALVRSRRQAS